MADCSEDGPPAPASFEVASLDAPATIDTQSEAAATVSVGSFLPLL
ncbi:hypothetical protein [Halostella litorea]|nr:hypothetical protein [Halostella litorea]